MPTPEPSPAEKDEAARRSPAGLKTRLDTLFAKITADAGFKPRGVNDPPKAFVFPAAQFWSLANDDDLKYLVADRAIAALGGRLFSVAVDEKGITVTPGTTTTLTPHE